MVIIVRLSDQWIHQPHTIIAPLSEELSLLSYHVSIITVNTLCILSLAVGYFFYACKTFAKLQKFRIMQVIFSHCLEHIIFDPGFHL